MSQAGGVDTFKIMTETKEEIKLLNPSITLDGDLVKMLAIEYCEKIKIFKGKNLCVKFELDDHFECPTGGLIVSIQVNDKDGI